MSLLDPERAEIRALERVTGWRGTCVLDIGCGDGRLSLRLARLGAKVVGVDPDPSDVQTARRQLPARYQKRVRYDVGSATRLKYPDESFEVALFSWSL